MKIINCEEVHQVKRLTLSLLSASLFEEKNVLFLLENASNLTHEFCMTIFKRTFNKIFLLKLSYKNSCVKFYAFS